MQREFEERLDIFMIISERHVNPKDPKINQDKNSYMIIVQTNERLDYFQTGGKDSWILNNEFNGARQILTVDLNSYRGGEWKVHFQNPRTKQSDFVLISHETGPKVTSSGKSSESNINKDGWKWTDILVIFMAVNFLLILGYQIIQNKNTVPHAKVY